MSARIMSLFARSSATPPPPSVLRCLLVLTTVKVGLVVVGFRRTCVTVMRLTSRAVEIARADDTYAAKSAERVAFAGAVFPARALCLEQALTLLYLLRSAGLPATLRLGVQPFPFEAHAWIEYRGCPLNENQESLRAFLPFPSIPGIGQ